ARRASDWSCASTRGPSARPARTARRSRSGRSAPRRRRSSSRAPARRGSRGFRVASRDSTRLGPRLRLAGLAEPGEQDASERIVDGAVARTLSDRVLERVLGLLEVPELLVTASEDVVHDHVPRERAADAAQLLDRTGVVALAVGRAAEI